MFRIASSYDCPLFLAPVLLVPHTGVVLLDLMQAFWLALVQGLTEFLPISSSAHLILPHSVLGWPDQGLAFDVAVHLGSLVAVLWYFRETLTGFIASGVGMLTGRGVDQHVRLMLQVGVATLPVILAGLLLKDFVALYLRTAHVIAATTIGFGLLLWWADRRSRAGSSRAEATASAQRDEFSLSWPAAIAIGASQILALIPGTSRSGITMTTALFLGLSAAGAARFSFLLSIPTILGAGLLLGLDLWEASAISDHQNTLDWGAFLLGFAVSGIVAYTTIRFFVALIDRTGMLPYVIYRLLLGGLLIVLIGLGLVS